MPNSKELAHYSDEEKLNLINASKDRLKPNRPYFDLCKNTTDLFYERINSKNQNYLWTVNDYLKAKSYLLKAKNNQLSI